MADMIDINDVKDEMTREQRDALIRVPEIAIADVPTDKPIITLDIDGVLNAFDHGRDRPTWAADWEDDPIPYDIDHSERVTIPDEMCDEYGYMRGRSFVIQWASGLMEDLSEIAKSGKATFLWLTSWNAYAGFLANTCFWPDGSSPVSAYVDTTNGGYRSSYAGKVIAMDDLCERMMVDRPDDPLPIVSFDDDAPWESKAWNLGTSRGGALMPSFFHGIGTDPRNGITRSQIAALRDLLG